MAVRWLWGTRRSVAVKAAGVGLVVAVMLGGAALGALDSPRAALGEPSPASGSDFPAPAPEATDSSGAAHGVAGVVQRRQGDVLFVRTTAGKLNGVRIMPDTVVRRGKQIAAAADLHEGDQIAAVGTPQGGQARPPRMEAKIIIIRLPRSDAASPVSPAQTPGPLPRRQPAPSPTP